MLTEYIRNRRPDHMEHTFPLHTVNCTVWGIWFTRILVAPKLLQENVTCKYYRTLLKQKFIALLQRTPSTAHSMNNLGHTLILLLIRTIQNIIYMF